MAEFKQTTTYTHQFLMVLASDHVTGATGKNGSLVVKLGKAGATGVTAAGTTAEVDSTNLPGVYSIAFTTVDTNTAGSLALAATATGCDPTNEFHIVRTQIFSDLSLTNGFVNISSNIKQNQAATIEFPMTLSAGGNLASGLTVTAQRSLGGAGFSPCVNSVTEIPTASGVYSLILAASDTNAASGIVLLTATGANPVLYQFTTQP